MSFNPAMIRPDQPTSGDTKELAFKRQIPRWGTDPKIEASAKAVSDFAGNASILREVGRI
jgi:hypothetical protein